MIRDVFPVPHQSLTFAAAPVFDDVKKRTQQYPDLARLDRAQNPDNLRVECLPLGGLDTVKPVTNHATGQKRAR